MFRLKNTLGILTSSTSLAVLSQALRMGSGMITLPLALRTVPSAEMGLYYTFIGIATMVTILDFGFGPTISRYASYAQSGARHFTGTGVPEAGGEPNLNLLAGLLRTSRIFYHRVAFLSLLFLVTLGSWFLHRQIVQASLPTAFVGCWVLIAISSCLAFGTSYFGHMLQGIGRVRESLTLQIQAQMLSVACMVVLLLCGFGIWSYAWGGLANGVFQRIRGRVLLNRFSPPSEANDADMTSARDCLKALWPSAWRMGVVMLGAYLINRFNTVLCAGVLGLTEAASFGLTLQLIGIIAAGSTAPLSVIWPRIAMLRVSKQNGEIVRLFAPRLYCCVFVFMVGIFALSLLGTHFLTFLGSKTSLLPPSLILLMGLVVGLEVHHSGYASLVITENQNPFVLLSIFGGIGVSLCSALLVRHLGVLGLILGQGGVQLAAANWFPVVRGIRGLGMTPLQYMSLAASSFKGTLTAFRSTPS